MVVEELVSVLLTRQFRGAAGALQVVAITMAFIFASTPLAVQQIVLVSLSARTGSAETTVRRHRHTKHKHADAQTQTHRHSDALQQHSTLTARIRTQVRDAQSYFYLTSTVSLGVFNLLGGAAPFKDCPWPGWSNHFQ